MQLFINELNRFKDESADEMNGIREVSWCKKTAT